MKPIIYDPSIHFFHFTDGNKLRDGTKLPEIGEVLTYQGTPKICNCGLHASRHPSDALQYAPGEQLHLVTLGKVWEEQSDKVVSDKRTILSSIDSTKILLKCARKYALDVGHLWNMPTIVKKFLVTGDFRLQSDAMDAASNTARDAQRHYFLEEVLKALGVDHV